MTVNARTEKNNMISNENVLHYIKSSAAGGGSFLDAMISWSRSDYFLTTCQFLSTDLDPVKSALPSFSQMSGCGTRDHQMLLQS